MTEIYKATPNGKKPFSVEEKAAFNSHSSERQLDKAKKRKYREIERLRDEAIKAQYLANELAHKSAVENLTSVDEVEAYDATQGW